MENFIKNSKFSVDMNKDTIFSPDRKYRYTLWRFWDSNPNFCMFIGLNPSTADETLDDPTIRRCIGFSKAWGYGAYCMTNLFGYRATDPKVMKQQSDPNGEDNIQHILRCASQASIILAAWGNHGSYLNQDLAVINALKSIKVNVHHLGLTKENQPKHPLYLKKDLRPELLWNYA